MGRFSTIGLLALVSAASLGLVPGTDGPLDGCGPGMQVIRPAVGEPLCSHGDDPQLAPGAAAASSNRADGPVPAQPVRCQGTGTDGPRVEVIALRAAGSRVVPADQVRRWVGQVEWTVDTSARQWDARRYVLWVTETAADDGCRAVVRDVAISASELGDFGRMVSALRTRGFDRVDRKYLIFAADDTYCGLASAPRDDRASAENRADRRTGYARVDKPCWDGGDLGFSSVAAHELLHTLGAVQDSAPNAHGMAHCSDEWDSLCYADGGGTMQLRCTDARSSTSGAGDHNNRLLDCNGDDYFRPSPPAGSYLATHWNVADSRFLWDGRAPTPAPQPGSGNTGGSSTGTRCDVAGVTVRSSLVCSATRG